MTGRADVLVVGGGPAGAAAAALLAAAGRDTVLIEREAGPHDKVCGEFLCWEAQLYLARLGVDLAALGAVPLGRVRLVEGERIAEIALPFPAVSLSRRLLDEALLGVAAGRGAVLCRGRRAVELIAGDDGAAARLEDGAVIAAGVAFLATGKHDLRGWRRPAGPQGDLIAFKQHLVLAPDQAAALDGGVELALFDGGYAGLQPVGKGQANLCLVVRRRHFERAGQGWNGLRAALLRRSPHLARRLGDAAPVGDRPLAIASIPYGHIHRRGGPVWRLGDQAAVIPSFAGGGMSIALHSARLAAATYLAGGTAEDFQLRLARDVAGPVRLATGLSRLLVRRLPQRALVAAALLWPGLMAAAAGATRLPERALA